MLSPLTQLAKTLYGNFKSKDELKKFAMLAGIFAFTIGIYWILRPLKDTVFMNVVGKEWLPYAKVLSLFIIIPLIAIYSKLVERYPRHYLFYIIGCTYGILALLFAFFINHPTIGWENHVTSPWRLLGWSWYVFIESFGSVVVALFWSFASDTSTPDSAKRGFPLIAMGGQVGGVVGPLVAKHFAKNSSNIPLIAFCTGILIFAMAAAVWFFMRVVPKDELISGFSGGKEEKKATGFLEGLRLMFSQKYLLGIFAIVSIFEAIVTILDFQFKYLAQGVHGHAGIGEYLFNYAVWTNGAAFLCILLGVNSIGRRIGLTASLLITPALIGIAVFVLARYQIIGAESGTVLGIAFFVMVFSKAINYALNQPSKEQLYIPTSKDAKCKSKAWIDMFGSRFSKGIGSGINMLAKPLGVVMFSLVSAGASFALIALWVYVALFVGKTNAKAIKEDKIVC